LVNWNKSSHPASEVRPAAEAAILETMAIPRWKQMRIWGVQKAGFDLEMAHLNSPRNIPATRAYIVFKKLADNSRVLDLQHRYETTTASAALRLLLETLGEPVEETSALSQSDAGPLCR
jgi:hypothetical protein